MVSLVWIVGSFALALLAVRSLRLSLWWINRSEWEGLIDVAGLEVEALYGGFERQPFTEGSREFVWVARKPA